MKKGNGKGASKKAALMGIFVALAFGFSYIEYLIPFDSFGVPGIKLGLANLVVMAALYMFGTKEAFFVSFVRIALSFALFGSITRLLYGAVGGTVSLAAMALLKKKNIFGITGVSVSGGVLHNVGQIFTAVFLLKTPSLFYYLPVLIVSGVITGAFNGIILQLVYKKIKVFGSNDK